MMVLQSTPTYRRPLYKPLLFVNCAEQLSCRLKISGDTLQPSTTPGRSTGRDSFSKEVQQRESVPLQPIEKRRLAGNFMHDLLHSYPARNTYQPGKCTMRQIVACAVCAYKDWIDDFYPCYPWKEAPLSEDVGATEHADDDDTGNAEDDRAL